MGYIDMLRIYHHHGGNMATHVHTTSSVGRVLLGLAVLFGLIGFPASESRTQDVDITRATLRGLRGVGVLVEPLDPDVERAGLTTVQLQTAVEGQLQKAGIPVFTPEERVRVPGRPFVYIHVQVVLRSYALATYFIRVEVNQRASLETDALLATVSTWSVGVQGTIEKARLNTLDDFVHDAVAPFITAYGSVHPRPAASPAPVSASSRRDLVRQVQERLQTGGFDPGTLDGAMGAQTQQALRLFQSTQGLRVTGDLDEPTLKALGIR